MTILRHATRPVLWSGFLIAAIGAPPAGAATDPPHPPQAQIVTPAVPAIPRDGVIRPPPNVDAAIRQGSVPDPTPNTTPVIRPPTPSAPQTPQPGQPRP